MQKYQERLPHVYLVDDDESVRASLCAVLNSSEITTVSCESAEEFLRVFNADHPGCLVLDIRMADMNGLDLLDKLNESGTLIPTIIISGHGDIHSAVRAMKAGAKDFIEKPFHGHALIEKIQKCIHMDMQDRQSNLYRLEFSSRLEQLTPREREVLDMIINAHSNKEIANILGISPRTVEAHRNKCMLKLQLDSIIDVVREMASYYQSGQHQLYKSQRQKVLA